MTAFTVCIMSTSNDWLQDSSDILRGERGDVGDQNVDAAERLRAVGDEFLKRGLVGHVDAGPDRPGRLWP